MDFFIKNLFHYFSILPLVKIISLTLLNFSGYKISFRERILRRLVKIGIVIESIALIISLFYFPDKTYIIKISNYIFTDWQHVIVWDKISFSAMLLSSSLFIIISQFSLNYLHRDRYIFKFYILLFIFQFSTCFFIFSESTQFIFMGWELLGLSSVLLIGFYEHRANVLKNALRVLVVYKISDLFLFGSFLYLMNHNIYEITNINHVSNFNIFIILSIAIACLIKSGLFPWFWLPRAMEGPTTSSSIFYGSIATHLPVFIFMRIWPQDLSLSHPLPIFLTTVLIIAIIFSSLLGRQISDVKNSLAYATISQLALIYLEVIFGFHNLALFHTLGHAYYRGFEYLKSPSQLYHHHQIENTRTSIVDKTGLHFEFILPLKLRKWLYALTLKEFGLFKSSFGFIDHFLDLKNTKYTHKSFIKYALISITFWMGLEFLFVEFSPEQLNYLEETFILFALIANIFAFVNVYHKKLFWLFISLSLLLSFDILEVKVLDSFYYSEWILAGIILLLVLYGIIAKLPNNIRNYTKRFATSNSFSVLIFLIGLSAVGIPGLGSYYIWESLVHSLSHNSPHLIIEIFYLLSLNTIVFFCFYFINYLGNKKSIY